MSPAASLWVRVRAIGIAAFVAAFLGAAIIQNVGNFLRFPVPLGAEAAAFLRALGAEQRWPMFGAYFPRAVRVPVVQLVLAGGRRVFLQPAVAPEFSRELAKTFSTLRLSAPGRRTRWRGNFGGARIGKYESRAASPAARWLEIRTAYAASRVHEWLDRNPDQVGRIRTVDLLSVKVALPHDGEPPTVVGVEPVAIEPDLIGTWPAPGARQLWSPAS